LPGKGFPVRRCHETQLDDPGFSVVGGVAMLAVDGFVHGAHVVGGDFAGERVESELDLRPALERFFADQRDGLVGREVVLVVSRAVRPRAWMGPSVELAAIMSTWWR
jgi:hypothetical protein